MQKKVVIIPTYNESENIDPIIKEVLSYVPEVHILVVDDNSPDGTAGVVEEIMKTNPRVSILKRKGKEGLGKAYRNAFEVLLSDPTVEVLCTFDADFSHDPRYLPSMFNLLKSADVVIGSRYAKGGGVDDGWTMYRKLLSRAANFYIRSITRIPVSDCTSGFHMIKTSQLRKIDLNAINSSGHAFLIELKYSLFKSGARMAEVPVILRARAKGVSKVSGRAYKEGLLAPLRIVFKRKA